MQCLNGAVFPVVFLTCLHSFAGSLLHKFLPFIRKRKPALVQLGSDMRYSEIMKEVNTDAATVAALLLAVLLATALKMAKAF